MNNQRRTKGEHTNMETKKQPQMSAELRMKLNNTAWQKGLAWRLEKIKSIAQARQQQISENEIIRELKKAGLTEQTARVLLADAHCFDGETADGLTEEEVKEEYEEDCQKRVELKKPKISFDEYKKQRAPRLQPVGEGQ